MSRFLSIIFALYLSVLTALSAGPSAGQVLDKAADAFQKAGSISASYSMTIDGHKSKGQIIISGDRFRLSSPQMSIWYDGKTQWTYNPDIKEVNITEPTPEELAETNPFVIISAFRNGYKSSLKESRKGTYRVDLTPKENIRQSSITRAILTLDSATYLPSDIAITLDGDQTIAIHLESLIKGKNYPLSTFVFNKADYPKAEIVDLR